MDELMITVSLGDLLQAALLIALIVLVVYVIKLVKRFNTTLDHVDKILADAEVVSGTAANRTAQLDKFVDKATVAVADAGTAFVDGLGLKSSFDRRFRFRRTKSAEPAAADAAAAPPEEAQKQPEEAAAPAADAAAAPEAAAQA
ncbi:MAG: hypothetical protein IJF62_03335 [Firmicutes bacterium]|nr:hypothetical protein [Bacillota bacterium]MBQ3111394.1 hypothetical protein [Bacillota bacterium]MBQ6842317.1 hypothetical protein [Bacillota bacterium]MBR6824814.1 hypothetical protein [Bacillota bacterium]MBR7113948.1 hypothetical protein [Bacillota bacterium]